MFRRIALALVFVVALGAAGVGLTSSANAHGGGCFPSFGYGGYGFGPVGGYAVAGYRMTGYPLYYSNYGYYPAPVVISGGHSHHGHHGHHSGLSISFGF